MSHTIIACSILLTSATAGAQIFVDDTAVGADDGTSWTDAYNSLEDALGAAGSGDQVWVAVGTYSPTSGVGCSLGIGGQAFCVTPGIRVFGGFAGSESTFEERAGLFDQTVLSGDRASNDVGDPWSNPQAFTDNADRVVAIAGGSGTILDGFLVTGGHIDYRSAAAGGAGIKVWAGTPRLRNLTVTRNYNSGSFQRGGGLEVNGAAPLVERCRFVENRTGSGAGVSVVGSAGPQRPIFVDCVFEGNIGTSIGSGLYAHYSEPVLFRCLFVGNRGVHGALGVLRAEVDVYHCRFLGNGLYLAGLTSFGGALRVSGDSVVRVGNSLFAGNRAGVGGAIAVLDSYGTPTVTLSSCTIVANEDMTRTGGIYSYGAPSTTVSNSVLWGNRSNGAGSQVAQVAGQGIALDHCCVEGWNGALGGIGNIGSDPLLVDSDGPDGMPGTLDDDPRLSAGSPCIDAADSSAVLPDLVDLDGDGDLAEPTPFDLDAEPRFFDDPLVANTGAGASPYVDMGAYERLGPPLGTSFCQPPVANTTGLPARLQAHGSPLASDDNVLLSCAGLPESEFGYFLTSRTQGYSPGPGGSAGNLCLSGNVGRFLDGVANSGPGGVFQLQVDLTAMPGNPVAPVLSGETWNYQAWYRDGSTSNFSDAVEIAFQ